MAIKVSDILNIQEPMDYKLHLACRNEKCVNPLDEYVADYSKWLGWNEWRGNRNDWTRPFVFALMDFYPISDSWLFGGIFKVLERCKNGYKLEEVDFGRKFEGRLIIKFHRYQGMRGRAFYLDRYFDKLEIAQILPERYTGEAFCGYDNICHDFNTLEAIFRNERSDWKAALSSIKGVYLIMDKSNGKKYVGSAYGTYGIWSRWACYIGTGHGWNDELTKLMNECSVDYARKNFQFSILEVMATNVSDQAIIDRESYWKKALVSKEHGYNKN